MLVVKPGPCSCHGKGVLRGMLFRDSTATSPRRLCKPVNNSRYYSGQEGAAEAVADGVRLSEQKVAPVLGRVKPRIGRRDRRQDKSGSLPLKSPPLITQPQAAFDYTSALRFPVNNTSSPLTTYASAHFLPYTKFSLRKCSTAFRHCPRTRGQLQFAPSAQ